MDISTRCTFCLKQSENGVFILGKFVCNNCEKTMVNLEVDDDRYDEYKELIKKNIYGDIILK